MDGLKFTNKNKHQGKVSLLQQAQELKKDPNKIKIQSSDNDRLLEEEHNRKVEDQNFMAAIKGTVLNTLKDQKDKMSAGGIKTSWKLPKEFTNLTFQEIKKIREKGNIMIEGDDVIPPITNFKNFNLPKKVLRVLKEKNLKKPTQIQSQVLPLAFMGRDIIGIAPSGQGKTLAFMLPALMQCLEQEMKMPIIRGEGPFAIFLVPSHELAIQTYETVLSYADLLRKNGYPQLKAMLNIGGQNAREQLEAAREGVHIIIGTPGRISDNLNKKKYNLDLCQYVVLDEADRLLDLIFEQDISNIFMNISGAKQTLLFSSTMPKKVAEFATACLYNPFVVNIGRAGSVNLNVVQEIEYIKAEDRLIYLLESLQKTSPQVIIFCDKISDVDDIQEYLIIKGVKVVALHGAKNQEDRAKAMKDFQSGKKDVLVATDLAAKGLDFPNIRHVINFDMPSSIQGYVHRIGRTCRKGKTGRATTMINKNQDTMILADLKHLLMESKQQIPAFMQQIVGDSEYTGGCGFCGGLGHRMADCTKLENQKMKAISAAITGSTKEDIMKFTKDDYEFDQENQVENQQEPYDGLRQQ